MHPTWTKARSDLANAVKASAPEHTVAELRRDLRAARLADYISRVVSEAPPLTDEQRDRLAGLLRPASTGGRRAG